jgi:predicted dehydrogenase
MGMWLVTECDAMQCERPRRNWRRHRDQTGPHMLEKCSHDIDILNWLLGASPTCTWMATRERIRDSCSPRAYGCARFRLSAIPCGVVCRIGHLRAREQARTLSLTMCRRSNAVPDMRTHHRLQKPEVGRTYRMWGAWEDVDPFDSDNDTEDNQVRSPRRRQRAMQRVFRDNSHVRAWGWGMNTRW